MFPFSKCKQVRRVNELISTYYSIDAFGTKPCAGIRRTS
ncbi:hypothetical protein IFVP136_C1240060 [Vibrio parahaemolyticus]